jgi:hypothetical protein
LDEAQLRRRLAAFRDQCALGQGPSDLSHLVFGLEVAGAGEDSRYHQRDHEQHVFAVTNTVEVHLWPPWFDCETNVRKRQRHFCELFTLVGHHVAGLDDGFDPLAGLPTEWGRLTAASASVDPVDNSTSGNAGYGGLNSVPAQAIESAAQTYS